MLFKQRDGVPDVMCGDGGTLPADEAGLIEQIIRLVTLQVFIEQLQSLQKPLGVAQRRAAG